MSGLTRAGGELSTRDYKRGSEVSPTKEKETLSARAKRAFKFGSELSSSDSTEDTTMSSSNEPVDEQEDMGEEIEVRVLKGEEEEQVGAASAEQEVEPEEEEASEPSEAEETLDATAQIIERHQAEARENYDKYVRAVAELENVKKRNAKDRADLIRYAGEALGRDIVDVIDDLERAAAQDASVSSEELLQGLDLILKRFHEVLGRHSIVADEALGTNFDPNKHEALATVPSADHEPGVVMEQFKKAYFFKDKLLRAAQVVVSAEQATASAPTEESEEEE